MGSKIIALVGVVVSATFVYYCIDLKKDEILNKCGLREQITKLTNNSFEIHNEKIEEMKRSDKQEESNNITNVIKTKTVYQKSDPAFGIIIDREINVVGMFAPEEKDRALVSFIDEMCTHVDCINDIRFSEDIKSVVWSKDLITLIQYFQENQIPGASIYINSNTLHIEGRVEDKQAQKRLQKLLMILKKDGLHIDNKMILEEQKIVTTEVPKLRKEENIAVESKETYRDEDAEQTKNDQTIKTAQTKTVQNIQKPYISKTEQIVQVSERNSVETFNIDTLLTQEPIQFDRQNRTLTLQSKNTLDRIAEYLKTKGMQKIRIKASANTNSDTLVNRIIAQKRATIVQNYLRRKGIMNSITETMANGDQIIIEIVE